MSNAKRVGKYAALMQFRIDCHRVDIGMHLLEASRALRTEPQFALLLDRLGFNSEQVREFIEMAQARLEEVRLAIERYEAERKRRREEMAAEKVARDARVAVSAAYYAQRDPRETAQVWKADKAARDAELAARQKMQVDLINAGYKALATKLHPDKGGSAVEMARLNKLRGLLRDRLT
jgi:hypothetical protein